MIALLAIGSILTGGGLRVEIPDDAAPAVFGLESNTRLFLLDDAFVGVTASWAGGVNDTNPDNKLIAQRFELLADLGYRLGTQAAAAQVTLRVGGIFVDRWPRGRLTRLRQLSGMAGAELAGVFSAGPVFLEPYAGYDLTRLNQIQVGFPSFGVRVTVPVGRIGE